jgi:hypothetical protein
MKLGLFILIGLAVVTVTVVSHLKANAKVSTAQKTSPLRTEVRPEAPPSKPPVSIPMVRLTNREDISDFRLVVEKEKVQPVPSLSREERVRQKAHELWIARGQPLGDPLTDWEAAEKLTL